MAKSVDAGRQRGHIRKRGNSYQVLLYAGVDPLTGRELRVVESTTDRAEATRILNRMRATPSPVSRPQSDATPPPCPGGYALIRRRWRPARMDAGSDPVRAGCTFRGSARPS